MDSARNQERVNTWLAFLPDRQKQYHKTRNTPAGTMYPSTPPDSHASSARERTEEAAVEDAVDIEALSLRSQPHDTPGLDESPSKKRARQDPESNRPEPDHEQTPRVLHDRPILRPVSPKRSGPRSRSPSPSLYNTVTDLQLLEKPVLVRQGALQALLPPDAQKLLDAIDDVNKDYLPFIPGEIRNELEVLNRRSAYRQPRERCYITPPSPAEMGADERKQGALQELGQVLDIRYETQWSSAFNRHEAAWNSAVHHPILKLAFRDGLEELEKELGGARGPGTRIRVENITSATIAGDCVPHAPPLAPRVPTAQVGRLVSSRVIEYDDHVSILAWSLSTGSSSASGRQHSPDPFVSGPDRAADGTAHSRSNSKKVDFALVLDPEPGSSLHSAVQAVLARLKQTPLLAQSINPSSYEPLVNAPIGVAIETKTLRAARSPLVQLGLIAAALHRRLHTLPVQGAVGPSSLTETGVLPTWPLFTVTDDLWRLYFACDRGSKIDLVGHFELGSSQTLESTYRLLAALRFVKAWLLETFCPAMESWLTLRDDDAQAAFLFDSANEGCPDSRSGPERESAQVFSRSMHTLS